MLLWLQCRDEFQRKSKQNVTESLRESRDILRAYCSRLLRRNLFTENFGPFRSTWHARLSELNTRSSRLVLRIEEIFDATIFFASFLKFLNCDSTCDRICRWHDENIEGLVDFGSKVSRTRVGILNRAKRKKNKLSILVFLDRCRIDRNESTFWYPLYIVSTWQRF